MNIVERISNLANEAAKKGNTEAANAYMIALLYIEDDRLERKKMEEQERKERSDSAIQLARAITDAYERIIDNAD